MLSFLQNLTLTADESLLVGLVGLALGFLALFLVFSLVIYIYLSLAYSAVGRKAKLKTPGLAWIPAIGPLIISYKASKMHWWPWLLLIGFVIPVIGFFANIVFMVFVVMWHWKMFESIRKPGWWSILMLIPIVNLIMIGVAAWSRK